MLDRLRSFAGSPIGILVFGFIIFGLLAFGVTAGGRVNVIARVGSEEIIAQDFQVEYETLLNQVAQQQVLTSSLREQVANYVLFAQMVPRAAFDDHINRLGLGLSDAAIATAMTDDSRFQSSNGVFNQTLLENYLRGTGQTERQFIESEREGLLRTQIAQAIAPANSDLPAAYDAILDRYFTERRTAIYTVIGPDTLGDTANEDPTDEEIAAYFEANQERWAAPELRTADLIVLTPERLADPDSISDEDAQAAYQARLSEFGTPEERTVSIFVFASRADADAAAAALADGTTFDALVEAGTVTPTNLGTVRQNGISNATLRAAAFALAEGGTEIVEGPAGPTLVHVAEIIESDILPFEEVADQVREEVALDRAAADINALYLQIEDARAAGLTLPEVGTQLGLEVESLTFDQQGNDAEGDPIADLPGSSELTTNVFESDVGLADAALRLSGAASYLWYEVTDVIPPRQRGLDEVRDRVVTAWRDEAVDLRMQGLAESIVALLRSGEATTDIESELGVVFTESEPVGRTSSPPEGLPDSFVAAVYQGDVGYAVATSNPDTGEYVVVKVTSSTVPDDPELDAAASQSIDAARNQLTGALIDAYVNALQTNFGGISINDNLVRQVIGVQ